MSDLHFRSRPRLYECPGASWSFFVRSFVPRGNEEKDEPSTMKLGEEKIVERKREK